MVRTELREQRTDGSLLLEHERIFFPSYPWEWTPGQWRGAAELTLDLCEEAVEAGYILKDATPLNVLFRGAEPVFVDVLSFERRDETSPVWMAYAQFVRTFLLPLAAHRYLGWPLEAALARRDGYEPQDLAPWLPRLGRWRDPLRTLVTLPQMLESDAVQARAGAGVKQRAMAADAATWMLKRTLRRCRKLLAQLAEKPRGSRWSDYTRTASHYSDAAQTAKQAFVREALESTQPATVLDVGANTGVYSRIAAECGATVVAWDTDLEAADENWRTAAHEKLAILPVVADFARPTPAAGWRNSESMSLLERARGRFDCVLMLGVVHHLLLADQVPLEAVLEQLAEITRRHAVVEWVPREDVQFAGLCRGRENLYNQLDESYFAEKLAARFTVLRQERLTNGRTLWLVEKAG
jgi:SAM-dependent methyltransferase